MQLFGTDGIRGAVFEGIVNPMDIFYIGMAVGRNFLQANNVFKKPLILVGRDSRSSCHMFASSIKAGIMCVGVDIIDCGIIPVAGLAFLVGKYGAVGAVMVSASHNKYQDNGIKILASTTLQSGMQIGSKITEAAQKDIQYLFESSKILPLKQQYATINNVGVERNASNPIEDYINFLISVAETMQKSFISSSTMPFSGLTVVLDFANGATVNVAKEVFLQLGANVVCFGDRPNGTNINDECGSTEPSFAAKMVLQHGANIGFCFDGDGDRVAVIDELGDVINGDHLLGFVASKLKSLQLLNNNMLISTISSNYGLDKFCVDNNIRLVKTPVGDKYVSYKLIELDASFGGEESGHLIFSQFGKIGDGIVAALFVSAFISANKDNAPSKLLRPFRLVNSLRCNVEYTDNFNDETFVELGRISEMFEIEANSFGGRVLVRKSGTEKKVRIIVEVGNEAVASDIFGRLKSKISTLVEA